CPKVPQQRRFLHPLRKDQDLTTALRQRMLQDLQLAGLSERTQEAYLRAVRKLADHFHTPPHRLSEHHVREHFLYLQNDRQVAAGSLRIASSATKFFYSPPAPRDWPTLRRLRVRNEKRLPDVLSVAEVRRLIAAVRTHHNRAYFWTVYSLGLRLEEGLHLQVGDVDGRRMSVHVRRGKGAKDRYMPLPGRTLTVLRQYWTTHRHPQWLFPSRGRDGHQAATADQPMTRATVQKAMSRVVQELGLKKAISVHSLRHSYATHLLEAGVNLRLIQHYPRNSSPHPTVVYLHLTTASQEQAVARIETLMGPD